MLLSAVEFLKPTGRLIISSYRMDDRGIFVFIKLFLIPNDRSRRLKYVISSEIIVWRARY